VKVIVIGGGVSGLATAYRVQAAVPDTEVEVLEASPRVGGIIQTHTAEPGLVMESGPHGFLNAHPSTLQLAHDLNLSPDIQVADEAARRRFLMIGGTLRSFPTRASELWSSRLLTSDAQLRLRREPRSRTQLPTDEDVTVGAFLRARLGSQVVERIVDPVIAGMNGGDVDRLSMRATLPKLAALADSGASFLETAIRHLEKPPVVTEAGAPIGRRLVSFRHGLGQLTGALARSLGSAVHVDFPVEKVMRAGKRWRVVRRGGGAVRYADVVVSTAPAPQAAGYLSLVDEELSAILHGLRYLPMVVVTLAYPRAAVRHPLSGFGYLVPSSEGSRVLGVLWTTSMFPKVRCGEDMVLLSAICGGSRDPRIRDDSDPRIVDEVRQQVRSTLGASGEPSRIRVARHQGLPQFEVGHLERIARLGRTLERHSGLFVTGNFLDGIGINACTKHAERIAECVSAHLSEREQPAWPPQPRFASAGSEG
jgi:oxygen-dependent protoporphyrinogen oxidase